MEQIGNKKIVMLGHKRVPSREGGIEVVVGELAARLIERGYSVTCLNRAGHHVSGKMFDKHINNEYNGIMLKSVWTIDRGGLAAITASISGAISAAFGQYDIVHFHAEGPCAMMWLPKLFGKRCIATIHGLDHKRARWSKLASGYIMLGEKVAARLADEIIVLNATDQEYFKAKYRRQTNLIPNGVAKPSILRAQLIKEKFGLSKDSYILFLGRLVEEKGVHLLINAYMKTNTDKNLVIAGGSSKSDGYVNTLKKLASSDSRIIFTDYIEGNTLAELYSNAYVYALPSEIEGMP